MEAPTVFRSAGFRRLVGAQGLSSFGDWLATFALMALVLEISGSAAAVGGVLALRLLPAAAAGPLVSWVGARWDRRRQLLAYDLIRAVAVALIPMVGSLWWVYSLTLVVESAAVLAITARDASIRELVARDQLPVANGMVLGATYGAIPLGAAAFTVIGVTAADMRLFGASGRFFVAFWLDALTFLGSFALIRGIRVLSRQADLEMTVEGHSRLRDAWRVEIVRATLVPVVAAALGIGTLFSLGIGFVTGTLGASESQFGMLVLVFGVGAVIGLGIRQWRGSASSASVRTGVQGMGAVMASMGLADALIPAFAMAAVFGLAGAYAIVSGITLLQIELDSADQLLALGAFHVAVRMALAGGAMIAGAAVDSIAGLGAADPVRMVLVVSGILVLVASTLVGRGAASRV